ncbi:MAG: PaaI family thioesterase [Deltaproteobacteria bacterium]|nr:PaaI family thioesterase [Deltaproteobacteria bacterium]
MTTRKINPEHIDSIISLMNKGPYFNLLSIMVKDLGLGYSLLEVDIENRHFNPFGGVHGGVYSSVVDSAAYLAVYCELDENAGLISLDLNVNFLAPIRNGKLIVKGRRIKIGKNICVAEATAFDHKNKMVAYGSSKLMVTQGLQTISQIVDSAGLTSLPCKFI